MNLPIWLEVLGPGSTPGEPFCGIFSTGRTASPGNPLRRIIITRGRIGIQQQNQVTQGNI